MCIIMFFTADSPVIYVAFVISHSHSNAAHFGEVKGRIVLMVVRSDPAYPNTRGFLPGKDPHRIVILKAYRDRRENVQNKNKLVRTFTRPTENTNSFVVGRS